jgi:UDP-2,3-diacylglucosamine hydrolase
MTAPDPRISSPIGLIAGGGILPFAVADSLIARNITPMLFALKGACDPAEVTRFRHHWIAIGQLGRLKGLLRAENCRELVFIGSLVRPSLSEIRLDWGTIRVMRSIWAAFRGGDDHLLSGIAGIFERDGFRMVGIKDVAPDLLMPLGSLTRASADDQATADIAKGRDLLRALSPFDIGQAAVVIDGHVVGVEDIEGTDGLLARIARLRAEGRIRAKAARGVLVKAPKRGQDLRFDLPTLGPRTIEGAAAASLAGIAIVAGNTIVAEPQAMIEAADRAGLFVTGLPA